MDTNVLYYGDNLDILRHYIPDESIDLIYLDPPFNSQATYNVLFREESGASSHAQIEAFEDTWHWGDATAQAYDEVLRGPHQNVARMLKAMIDGLGHNQVTAYLVMMAIRLVELHRILKPTGCMYLHCDPTASHYLKILLDADFGPANFRNEITWKRRQGFTSAVHESNRYGNITDILLFYSKSAKARFRPQYNKDSKEYQEYVDKFFTLVDNDGRKYQATSLTNPAYRPNLIYEYKGYKAPANGWMITKEKMEQWDKQGRIHFPASKNGRLRRKSYADELKGMPIQNLWDDIDQLGAGRTERLGYPTQKPLALLERIINASSNPGDIVLDPFCGCGTAVHAAQKLGRKWIGIDVTFLAINLIESRMKGAFPELDIKVIGEPADLTSARDLARRNKKQFELWALMRLGAQPSGKKGADRGIDGLIPMIVGGSAGKPEYARAIVSVKGGEHVSAPMVRDLKGVLDREGEPIGILLTLTKPTKDMSTEAASSGFYESALWQKKYPRIQIITIEDLLNGKRPDLPSAASPFAKAPLERERGETGRML